MTFKSILVANNHLNKVGGSETFSFALIEALVKQGYHVEYFTFYQGIVSQRIEDELNVSFMSKSKYDLILANHNTCVNYLSRRGLIIQTCHGIFPKEEQPSKYADGHIAISKEVQAHLQQLGYASEIILNGINCERYRVDKPINDGLQKVLSLSQSESANAKIEAACDQLGLHFSKFNKNENPIWHIEDHINAVDLVVGLGRSAYEAMACGRPVVVFDERAYFKSYSDGYLTADRVLVCVENNCSGRTSMLEFATEDLVKAFSNYKSQDGVELRDLALKIFNMELQSKAYLNYAASQKKRRPKLQLLFVSWYQKHRMRTRLRKQKRKQAKA